MPAIDEILSSLPLDQLAQETGASPQDVEQAAAAALPALLGGLQANADDPSGASSILEALGQHQTDLLDGGVDLSRIDPADGERIASHIFGDNEDQVVERLGALGASGAGSSVGGQLVKRLIPILAPIVLSWLANKVLGGAASGGGRGIPTPQGGGSGGQVSTPAQQDQQASSGSGPGSLDEMLKDVLGGATGQSAPSRGTQADPAQQPTGGTGDILTNILGGLLGGGRR